MKKKRGPTLSQTDDVIIHVISLYSCYYLNPPILPSPSPRNKILTPQSLFSLLSLLRHGTMHSLSATAVAAASLRHLNCPDPTVSPVLPPLPNFTMSHCSPSSLLAYSQLLGSELDPVAESPGLLNSEASYSGSSGACSSYGSPTWEPGLIQRSVSSHGLDLQLSALGPVRRVYSAGDLQGRAERTWSSESSMIIEGMAKACRYSPEEKRERIERYKTKRNQRNFNKKIKYECRKTLADSRRRIRGRFARNEETEHKNSTTSPVESWSYAAAEYDGEDDGSWISFLDSCSVTLVP